MARLARERRPAADMGVACEASSMKSHGISPEAVWANIRGALASVVEHTGTMKERSS